MITSGYRSPSAAGARVRGGRRPLWDQGDTLMGRSLRADRQSIEWELDSGHACPLLLDWENDWNSRKELTFYRSSSHFQQSFEQ